MFGKAGGPFQGRSINNVMTAPMMGFVHVLDERPSLAEKQNSRHLDNSKLVIQNSP